MHSPHLIWFLKYILHSCVDLREGGGGREGGKGGGGFVERKGGKKWREGRREEGRGRGEVWKEGHNDITVYTWGSGRGKWSRYPRSLILSHKKL